MRLREKSITKTWRRELKKCRKITNKENQKKRRDKLKELRRRRNKRIKRSKINWKKLINNLSRNNNKNRTSRLKKSPLTSKSKPLTIKWSNHVSITVRISTILRASRLFNPRKEKKMLKKQQQQFSQMKRRILKEINLKRFKLLLPARIQMLPLKKNKLQRQLTKSKTWNKRRKPKYQKKLMMYKPTKPRRFLKLNDSSYKSINSEIIQVWHRSTIWPSLTSSFSLKSNSLILRPSNLIQDWSRGTFWEFFLLTRPSKYSYRAP